MPKERSGEKRAARQLAAERGISYTAALRILREQKASRKDVMPEGGYATDDGTHPVPPTSDPFAVMASVEITDDDTQTVVRPLTGYDLFLVNRHRMQTATRAKGSQPASDPEEAIRRAREVWPEAEVFERAPGGWTFRVGGGYGWITESGRVAQDAEGLRSHARRRMIG